MYFSKLVVGYGFTRILEKYKLKEALKYDLAKERLLKINKMWEQMVEDKFFVVNQIGDMAQSSFIDGQFCRDTWETKVHQYTKNCRKRAARFNKNLNKNRYWLRDETYSELSKYYYNIIKEISSSTSLKPDEIKEFRNTFLKNFPNYRKTVVKYIGVDIDL